MKKKLIQLATKKGFNSKISSDMQWKYSTKESLRYHLWLQELKLWVEEKLDRYLSIDFNVDMIEQLNDFENWSWTICSNYWSGGIEQSDYSKTYEESLELGLHECLTMIKI